MLTVENVLVCDLIIFIFMYVFMASRPRNVSEDVVVYIIIVTDSEPTFGHACTVHHFHLIMIWVLLRLVKELSIGKWQI